jgi:hypothetical protein
LDEPKKELANINATISAVCHSGAIKDGFSAANGVVIGSGTGDGTSDMGCGALNWVIVLEARWL